MIMVRIIVMLIIFVKRVQKNDPASVICLATDINESKAYRASKSQFGLLMATE